MIYQDIEFVRPRTIAEALEAFNRCEGEGLGPEYFSGGTELVTMARDGRLTAGAFIDLKAIEETRALERSSGTLRLGSSVVLNALAEEAGFPFFSRCVAGLADHTVRNSVTLGGNIAGKLPYREAVLPLLLADATAVLADGEGSPTRSTSLRELFDKRIRLAKGAFLVAFELRDEFTERPFFYRRWQKSARVDYPLVTVAAVAEGGQLLFALSGSFAYPVWSSLSLKEAGDPSGGALAEHLESLGSFHADPRASAEYRRAITIQGLQSAAEELG